MLSLFTPFVWQRYSKKLEEHILSPTHLGSLSKGEGRLVVGEEVTADAVQESRLFLQVDTENGRILTAKFKVFGESILIGLLDALCDLLEGRNLLQANRLTAHFLEKTLRDHANERSVPQELEGHLNFVMDTLENALLQCEDIEVEENYETTPLDALLLESEEGGYPNWTELKEPEKFSILQKVLEEDILPFVELDGGSVAIKELQKSRLIIEFSGNCGSCPASQTSTLAAIQSILRAKVHADLEVAVLLADPL